MKSRQASDKKSFQQALSKNRFADIPKFLNEGTLKEFSEQELRDILLTFVHARQPEFAITLIHLKPETVIRFMDGNIALLNDKDNPTFRIICDRMALELLSTPKPINSLLASFMLPTKRHGRTQFPTSPDFNKQLLDMAFENDHFFAIDWFLDDSNLQLTFNAYTDQELGEVLLKLIDAGEISVAKSLVKLRTTIIKNSNYDDFQLGRVLLRLAEPEEKPDLGNVLLKLVETNKVELALQLIELRPDVPKNHPDAELNTPLHVHMRQEKLDERLLTMLYTNNPGSTARNLAGHIPLVTGIRYGHCQPILVLVCRNPEIAKLHSLEMFKEVIRELSRAGKQQLVESLIYHIPLVKENRETIAFDLFITHGHPFDSAVASLFPSDKPLLPASMPAESLFPKLFSVTNLSIEERFSTEDYCTSTIRYFLKHNLLRDYSEPGLGILLRELMAHSKFALAAQLIQQRPSMIDAALSQLKERDLHVGTFVTFLRSCRMQLKETTPQSQLFRDMQPNQNMLNAAINNLLDHVLDKKSLNIPAIELAELMQPGSLTRKIIDKFSARLNLNLLQETQVRSVQKTLGMQTDQ